MDLKLDSSVQYIPRVGPAKAKLLAKLGLVTVQDLLFYPPFRYNDFSHTVPIAEIKPGDTVTIRGQVLSHKTFVTKNGKRMQNARVADDSGSLDVIWFNQPYLISVIPPGSTVNLAGSANWFGRKLAMMSPDYELVDENVDNTSLHTGRIVPVYSETEGVTSKWLRGRISYILGLGLHTVPDYLPNQILQPFKLMDLSQAISLIHFPKTLQDANDAKHRLAFDEMLLLRLTALEKRYIWETTQKSFPLRADPDKISSFISSLPFQLTDDQTNVLSQIERNLTRDYPMNRLLEGDVGCGKTVVAAISMYIAHLNGLQSILMAPTQILAEQHFHTLSELFTHAHIPVHLMTGTIKTNVNGIFEKNAIIVGTHALLSQSVNFQSVGCIIIDEQQRFGVAQRQLLREKGSGEKTPHLLTMTATPIPRTIALALYGNLDLSIINQMPKGRIIVKTWVVATHKRQDAYKWIKKQLKGGMQQAFIICPLIEESETLITVKSVKKEYEYLQKEIFPDLKLALLHGKLKPKEKTEILEQFRSGSCHMLISTPVVEVGIDIPNATIMVIEGSERFGLAQLHQLRGRVGRRNQQAYCLLFTEADDDVTLKRLKFMETVHNGPQLAEIDLAIRGPGELFGTRQHGLPKLRYATLLDTQLMEETESAAHTLFDSDPALTEHPLLRQKLDESIMQESTTD